MTVACGPLFVLGAILAGCVPPPPPGDGDNVNDNGDPVAGHADVAMRDRLGNPITADSTDPYSPRQTCGATGCHEIDVIANGYHFQQGRTNVAGDVVTQDDFFGDGRTWLKSAGMYGKW